MTSPLQVLEVPDIDQAAPQGLNTVREPVISPVNRSIWELAASVCLPAPRQEVFSFFQDARNLETLTPKSVNFSMTSNAPIEMKLGTDITYNLRIRGIPILWHSVITLWDPPCRFTDVQARGPYRLWHHLHTFEDVDGYQTRVSDRVLYSPPLAFITHPVFVKRELIKIFTYRQKTLLNLFSQAPAGSECRHETIPTS
ncbi:MAG: SRPBCC family protein [Verrucomicrobia bacterium]|nr:SRPBCC family protein [Verrucomicrobiota bacterium]